MNNGDQAQISLRKAKKNALLLAFPSKDEFFTFKNEDKKISEQSIPEIIRYAYESRLIRSESEEALVAFIENNTDGKPHESFAKNLSFREILDAAKGKMSVNALVSKANHYAKKFKMPTIHASMITNLKQNFKSNSPKKRAVLRMIAFWIGLNRPTYPFDYKVLINLPAKRTEARVPGENDLGVRIDITFKGQNEIVSLKMIDWLRKEIPKCIEDLKLYDIIGVSPKFYSATTATLEIPNYHGTIRDPRHYGKALKGCFAIAHQISIRWSLCDINSKKQSTTIIAIAAGSFAELSAVMPHLLKKDMPENASIRVNEYAHFISRISDIKVLFEEKPYVSTLAESNTTLRIWFVKYFWYLYYDTIPNLLDKTVMPTDNEHYRQFKEELYFSNDSFSHKTHNKILHAISLAPHNHQLIIEASKVLMARRMFAEANKLLTLILASDPYHLMARIIRIKLLLNIGMNHSNYKVFNSFFNQAIEESRLIRKTSVLESEVWSEIGLMHACKAHYIVRLMRQNRQMENVNDKDLSLEKAIIHINKAIKCFQKGATHSPNEHRSYFWIIHLRYLKTIFIKNRQYAVSQKPILDQDDVYTSITYQHLALLGYFGSGVFTDKPNSNPDELIQSTRHFRKIAANSINAVYFRSFRPSILYAAAIMLLDGCPILTTGIAIQALECLEEARSQAKELSKNCLGINPTFFWDTHYQNPEHFIRCIDKTTETIHKSLKEDINKDEKHIIDKKKLNGLKLITMHFDEIADPSPLLMETST